jgi:hypothetical protein
MRVSLTLEVSRVPFREDEYMRVHKFTVGLSYYF